MAETSGVSPMLQIIGAIIGIIGGALGIFGGIAGLFARYRAPRLSIAYTDFIGIVLSHDRTTSKIHLPVTIANGSNKPGVITHMTVRVVALAEGTESEFNWGLFWREHEDGGRSPERRPTPIPIPALSAAERSIQFEAKAPVKFIPQTYRGNLEIRAGRARITKRVSNFYFRPSEARCKSWYTGPRLSGPTVEMLPLYREPKEVPAGGD